MEMLMGTHKATATETEMVVFDVSLKTYFVA